MSIQSVFHLLDIVVGQASETDRVVAERNRVALIELASKDSGKGHASRGHTADNHGWIYLLAKTGSSSIAIARLLTARCLAIEVDGRGSELLVALLPVVLGAVRLSLNTADRCCLDLIHISLRVGDSSGDTSGDTTGGANDTADGSKGNVEGNRDQDSGAALDRGSNGDSAEESLERNHIEGRKGVLEDFGSN